MPFVGDDLAYALKPSLWATEVLGFDPDPWQEEVLDSTASRILLNCSRQSGKSSVSSILSLHTALFQPSILILMVSPSLRQSGELFRKFLTYLEILEPMPGRIEDTKLSLKLDNGSRVVSLPGSEGTIRGYSSVSLMVIDEAARVADDLYYAVKPMLAVSRGRMLAISTPWGKRGWWFDEWSKGQGWQKHLITAEQCSRISREFLDEERKSMPKAVFQSEYECQFTQTEDSCFDYNDVMRAISDGAEPLEI